VRQYRPYQSLLFAGLGVAIVAAVIVAVGAERTLRALAQASPGRLALGTALVLVVCGLRVLRWYVLLRAVGGRISVRGLVTSYFLGAAAGMVTPARLGELSAARIAGRAAGTGSAEAASAIAVDRALEWAFLACGAGIGATYLHTHGLSEAWLRHLVLVVIIILGLSSFILIAAVQGWVGLTKLASAVARWSAKRKRPGWLSRISANASNEWLPRLHTAARQVRSSRRAWVVLVCLVGMSLAAQATMYSCLATSVLRAPWLLVVACALLAFGAGQASAIPGGAGVGLATFVGAAVSAGCDPSQAAAGAVIAGALPTAFVWGAAAVSLVARVAVAAHRCHEVGEPSRPSGELGK